MADRTLAMMVANVQRKVGTGPAIPRLEIMQALNTAHLEIHGAYDWPWAVKEVNIDINPSYSTGTVSVADGSPTVTGTTTAWDIGWTNKRIRLDSNQDWPIATVNGVGTLTLSQAYHGTASLVDATYMIYQDVYQMPADFEPGKDMILTQPDVRIRVRHIPRMQLETQAVVLKNMFTNLAMAYTDQGRDSTGRYLIRILPPPTNANSFRLVYKARPSDFAALTDLSWLPQTYQDILELMAESEVKRTHGVPGWDAPAAIAARKRLEMKRQVVTGPVDNKGSGFGGTPMGNSSISWNGMSILPMP